MWRHGYWKISKPNKKVWSEWTGWRFLRILRFIIIPGNSQMLDIEVFRYLVHSVRPLMCPNRSVWYVRGFRILGNHVKPKKKQQQTCVDKHRFSLLSFSRNGEPNDPCWLQNQNYSWYVCWTLSKIAFWNGMSRLVNQGSTRTNNKKVSWGRVG